MATVNNDVRVSQSWGAWFCSGIEEGAARIDAFISRHFAFIAFAASCVVMLCCAAPAFIAGAVAGAVIHCYINPHLKLDASHARIAGVVQATIGIVGAVASVVALTPSGAAGGFVFHSIPFFCSLLVGSTFYRGYAAYIR